MNINSKILVAGHTGLIGSAFARFFHKNKFKNVFYISSSTLDLTKKDDVEIYFKTLKPDYVFLTAGKVGGILENSNYPVDFIHKNLTIQTNVFDSAIKNKVKKLLFFGSSCMYPSLSKQPMKESYLLSGPPESTSISYAIAKLAGLYACMAYNKQYKKSFFIPVIPNSVYGANDNFNPESGHVLSSLIYKFYDAKINNKRKVTLWGTGEPRREFIYVDDLVEACILILEKELNFLPINIGYGTDISIKSLAILIANEIGFDGNIFWDNSKPNGAMQKLLDSEKIFNLGWKPKIGLHDGIRNTIDWYKNNYEKKS